MHISHARDTFSPQDVNDEFSMRVRSMYDNTSASDMLAEFSRSRKISAVPVTGSVGVLVPFRRFLFLLGD
jgi:hypothetical protein